MLRNRPIAKGVLVFVVFYSLLAIPWPGLQETYSGLFRRAGDAVFGSYGERGVVRFLPLEKPARSEDTEITTAVRGSPYEGASNVSPRLMGYLPAVEVAALILASSVPWRRRLTALVFGLVLVHAFIYLRLALLIRLFFSNDIATPQGPFAPPWKLHDTSPTVLALLNGVNEVVNIAPVATFVVPVLIWIAVTFRYSDWLAFARPDNRAAPGEADDDAPVGG